LLLLISNDEEEESGILGTEYPICSRPDWYGVPGIRGH